jgi:ABC-2 type transport system permease protein
MKAILFKELSLFFNSILAYVILSFFLMTMGVVVWVLPETNVLDLGHASLNIFFEYCPYMFLFFIPAITMHTFAEERKHGTLEMLFSLQISRFSIVLGKYLACIIVVLILLVVSTIYYWILYYVSSPVGNIDAAAVVGSYFGLLLLSSAFIAIGLLASICTSKQLVAFLLGTFFCFFFYQGFESWKILTSWSKNSFLISQLGIKYHYKSISRGVIDSRDLFYFLGIISVFVFFCTKCLKKIA